MGQFYFGDQNGKLVRITSALTCSIGPRLEARQYFIKCTHVVKNDAGRVIEVHATYYPATRGGDSPDRRKVKSTIHWVSAAHAKEAEIRMYDRLFSKENPEEGEDGFLACLNPNSLEILKGYVEPSLASPEVGSRFQFERLGYFCVDPDGNAERMVFNRTIDLRDSWAKLEKKLQGGDE